MSTSMQPVSASHRPQRPFRSRAKHTPEERAEISRQNLAKGRIAQTERRAHASPSPQVQPEPERLTPAQQIYRDAKAAKATRDAIFMATVRAELDAAMALQTAQRKKGPRFGGRIEVRCDPADALIVALEGQR